MKTINFISGLPRSGSGLITQILNQNPQIHGEAVSSLANIVSGVNASWGNIEANQIYDNTSAKIGALNGLIHGYYDHVNKPVVFDRDLKWVYLIPVLEAILQKEVKVLVCVRNPAEILTSFERLRKENPLYSSRVDAALGGNSSIASRAYYYAGPEGVLGVAHRNLKDAVTMGHLDKLLFVDYSRYCNSPKSQTKRIYEFFELPQYQHDFDNITSNENYNGLALGLPNMHRMKPGLVKTTVNCVEYLGLDLYEQYNREIFWNAWI